MLFGQGISAPPHHRSGNHSRHGTENRTGFLGGVGSTWKEVTLQVKTILETGKTIQGDLRGVLRVPDPAVGKHKFLLVIYSRDGKVLFTKVHDHAGKLKLEDLKAKEYRK